MPIFDTHIFRAYDIRGTAYSQLSSEACYAIAYNFGYILRELYNLSSPRLAVGRDARTHGPEFEESVIRGLMDAGCHVLCIGQTPSPVNYFTICHQKLDGGIQVTASHNPKDDNGLKLQMREAEAFAGDDIQALRTRIESTDSFEIQNGSKEEYDAETPYKEHLTSLFGSIGEGMHVAVDAGSGVAGPFYCDILRSVGCKVEELYTQPDGTFPHHQADPSKWDTLKELQELVVNTKANCGFAYDGDGDRVGLVDEKGTIRTADEILLLLAKDHLSRFQNKSIVFTVSNSGSLESEVSSWGGKPVMCKVGHSFVEHAMREHNALLGGEQSGHFFCGESYYGFDDALVATLRLLSILSPSNESLSSLCADFPTVYQRQERRPHCPDDKKQKVMEHITQYFSKQYPVITLDGVRIDFGNGAWAGIRQSNTSPCLSVCLEARSEEGLASMEHTILSHLTTYDHISFPS